MVSIVACHAIDPGSIPGRGAFFCFSSLLSVLLIWFLPLFCFSIVVLCCFFLFLLTVQCRNSCLSAYTTRETLSKELALRRRSHKDALCVPTAEQLRSLHMQQWLVCLLLVSCVQLRVRAADCESMVVTVAAEGAYTRSAQCTACRRARRAPARHHTRTRTRTYVSLIAR